VDSNPGFKAGEGNQHGADPFALAHALVLLREAQAAVFH
jgi:hypothetical protein